ncbi:MAG: hypothetical protein H3C27_08615 [Opitutaceae bacterium]|nr:hypothetical protein [Opitutaceae bacterium]
MSESSETQTPPAAAKATSAAAITPLDMPQPTGPAKPPASTQEGTAPSGSHTPAPAGSTPAPASSSAETDSRGTPFDPAKHLRKKHPSSGVWMPKGGRKPKAAAGAASAGSFIPSEVPPEPAPSEPETKAPSANAEVVDHADDAAEVVCRAAQFTAGIALDAPEDCTPAPAEHANMRRATAGYIRAKGWEASAGVALLLVFAAWLLRIGSKPKPQAKIKGWFQRDLASSEKPREASDDSAPAQRGNQPTTHGLPAGIPPLA